MIKYLFVIGALLSSSVYAENMFKNGDMSQGGGWRGDREFVEDSGNRAMQLRASKNRKTSFEQEIKNKGIKKAKLTFRYKTSDYTGLGFEVRKSAQGQGSSFNMIKPKVDGSWQTYSSDNVHLENSDKNTFIFTLMEGTGSILFDDVSIEKVP